MEGAQAPAEDVASVRTFYQRGVRVISLTHEYNNALGGSGSPSIPLTNIYLSAEQGLTDRGRAVLSEMAKYGMCSTLRIRRRRLSTTLSAPGPAQ